MEEWKQERIAEAVDGNTKTTARLPCAHTKSDFRAVSAISNTLNLSFVWRTLTLVQTQETMMWHMLELQCCYAFTEVYEKDGMIRKAALPKPVPPLPAEAVSTNSPHTVSPSSSADGQGEKQDSNLFCDRATTIPEA